MASETPTQVMSMTKRYGNTVFTINAFCSENGTSTFEEKLLELIRNDMSHVGNTNADMADSNAASGDTGAA